MKSILNKYKILAFVLISFVLVGISMPSMAQAVDTKYTPLAPLPCIPSSGSIDSSGAIIPSSVVTCGQGSAGSPQTSVNVQTYIQYAVNLLIALAAVAAVFMITWGGFEYMTTDAVTGKEEGRKKITNAIYGLLLVLCSYLILRTINPQFVQIPVGLVTPLGLSSQNTTADWLTTVGNEMNAYNVNQTALRQTIADANAAAAVLQNQLSVAQNAEKDACYTYGDTSQECKDAMNKTDSTQNQLIQLQSNTGLITAKGIIDGNVAACGTTGSLNSQVTGSSNGNCYTNNLAAIDSILANSTLTSRLQPNDLQALKNYAATSKTTLTMDSWVNYYNQSLANYNQTYFGAGDNAVYGALQRANTAIVPGALTGSNAAYNATVLAQTNALANIDADLQSAKSTVTDPAEYQQLVTQAQALKAQISSQSPKKP